MTQSLSPAQLWIAGARPRTLPAAVAPVLAGTGAAAYADSVVWWKALLALGVSLALQIGVNYANDYSDGIKGTDDDRVGPLRLVGSGLVPARHGQARSPRLPGARRRAGLRPGRDDDVVAAAGRHRRARRRLDLHRRPVAVRLPRARRGQRVRVLRARRGARHRVRPDRGRSPRLAVAASIGVGALACAILVANNLRDIPTDSVTGKRTLAVVLGDANTRRLFTLLVLVAIATLVWASVSTPWALLGLAMVPLAVRARQVVASGAGGHGADPRPARHRPGRARLRRGPRARPGARRTGGPGRAAHRRRLRHPRTALLEAPCRRRGGAARRRRRDPARRRRLRPVGARRARGVRAGARRARQQRRCRRRGLGRCPRLSSSISTASGSR